MERLSTKNEFALLDLSFATNDDSVFWDSHSSFHGSFFFPLSVGLSDALTEELVGAAEGDSFALLVEPIVFFRERFGTSEVPAFCVRDSAVKVHCRVRDFFSREDVSKLQPSLEEAEERSIASFFRDSIALKNARDRKGFYWVEKPGREGEVVRRGERVKVAYRGYFLNGRVMEAGEAEFTMSYGDPSQLIDGLNIVMGVLKAGQNCKIILPSRLAFGSQGSSTGIVPPFTPLLYEVSVNRE